MATPQRPQTKSKFITVGSMLQGKENDAQGRPTYYIKLDSKAKITIDGVDVSGSTLQVSRPTDKFDRMLAAGKMEEAEYDQKTARFGESGDLKFIKFELSAKI